jgi:hypothetical protein
VFLIDQLYSTVGVAASGGGGERILLLIEIQGEESNSLEQVHIWRSRCHGIQNMNHTCPTSSGPSALLVQTSRMVPTCQDYRLAVFF